MYKIFQIESDNSKTLVVSGDTAEETLNNLLAAINEDAIDTENCYLELKVN